MNPRLLRPIASGVHPEAAAWRTAVVANGGSVSASTMRAVSRFCSDIDKAVIRDRFFRLNLFCGNSDSSLVAVRTPLYRGPSRTGAQYGATIDTNGGNNFQQGDYTETGANGGLIGNTTNKYLDTGLATNALPSVSTGHLSVWTRGGAVTGTERMLGGQGGSPQHRFFLDRRLAPAGGDQGCWGLTNSASTTDPTGSDGTAGLFLTSRTSATSLITYKNAVAGPTFSTSVVPVAQSFSFFVFANSNAGSPDTFYQHRLAAYSIGDGLSGQEVTSFYNALNTFMGALSRT